MSNRKILARFSLMVVGLLLVVLTPALHADIANMPDAEDGWGEWTALGKGYVARRKEPPKALRQAAEERRFIRVRERQQPKIYDKNIQPLAETSTAIITEKTQTKDKSENQLSLWLRTRKEGLYSVSIDDLAAEFGQSADSLRTKARKGDLSLSNADNPVPLYFDQSRDALLFVGEAHETFYTDENAYKFIEDKNSATQMAVNDGLGVVDYGERTPFRDTLKFEEEPDLYFLTWVVADEPDADFWFWDHLYGGYKDLIEVELDVPDPALTGTAQIRIRLRGATDMYPDEEHHVYAELNGTPVGQPLIWDGFDELPLIADFDQVLLNPNGTNTLSLRTVYSPGEHPLQLLENIEISYERLPIANDGAIWLHEPTDLVQTVSGFSGNDIFVIESPNSAPVMRKDILVELDGESWAVNFETKGGVDYLVVEADGLLPPVPSLFPRLGLKDLNNRAEYLIIAPRQFRGTAEELSDYRKKRFTHRKIVWLDEIYTEFSDGIVDPSAITRFMEWTKNWRVPPSYVMLLGKGTVDHKDRLGYADSFVPIAMTSTPWALAASDERLLAGDGEVSFAIGRLPITTDEEGLAYVNKLVEHESTIPGSEHYEAVLAADNPDAAGDFHLNTVALSDRLLGTGEFEVVTMLLHPHDPVQASLIDSGTWETGYVSYDGHGSATQVGSFKEKFISSDDAALLNNYAYPIFTALTCASGDYSLPGLRSLASTLVLNPTGGAIASFAPTGLSLDADAQLLGNAFVDSLYTKYSTVGKAVLDAKDNTITSISAFMPPLYSVVGEPAIYARER